MTSTPIKWIASIVFGLLVGRAAFSVVNPLLILAFGLNHPTAQPYVADDPAIVDRMLMTGTVISALITVAVAAALLRIANNRRRVGWGCVLLGAALLLALPASLLMMDPAAHDPATAGARAANDANTALFFWALIFGLPYLGGGLLLTIGGTVLIRKNREPISDATTTASR